MKKVILAAVIPASFALAATPSLGDGDNAGKPAAAACTSCHQGSRSFEGRDSDELAAGIRALLDGKLAHPPVSLDDTSDEALAELAKQLTGE